MRVVESTETAKSQTLNENSNQRRMSPSSGLEDDVDQDGEIEGDNMYNTNAQYKLEENQEGSFDYLNITTDQRAHLKQQEVIHEQSQEGYDYSRSKQSIYSRE